MMATTMNTTAMMPRITARIVLPDDLSVDRLVELGRDRVSGHSLTFTGRDAPCRTCSCVGTARPWLVSTLRPDAVSAWLGRAPCCQVTGEFTGEQLPPRDGGEHEPWGRS